MSHYSSSMNYTSNAPYAVYPAETTTRSHRVPRQTMPPIWPDVNQQAWGYHQHSPEYGVINQNTYGGVTAAPGTSTLHQTMPLPPRSNYHALPAHQPWSESSQFTGYLPTGSSYLHTGEQSPGSVDANRGYHLDTHSTQPPTARGSAYKTIPTILQQSLTLTIEDLRQRIRLVPIQSTVYRVHMDAAQFSLACMPSET
jgi:hypothetical protein